MKQMTFLLAVVLGLACTSAALYGAAPEDFALEILPADNQVLAPGSADLEIMLKTTIDDTQGWSLGVILDADAGVSATISALKQGDALQTMKNGDPADFEALNYYAAGDLGTAQGSCSLETAGAAGCAGIDAGAFNQGITIHILTLITLPATPGGVVVANFSVAVDGPEGAQARVNFADNVGDPAIATVAVHSGLSYSPASQTGAVITLASDPRVKPAQLTAEIQGGEGATNDQVDGLVTLNFDDDPSNPNTGDIQAWSYGLCIEDTSKLSVVAATSDSTMTAMAKDGGPPEFDVVTVFEGGVTHAVALSVNPPLATIPAQNAWTDLVVTYEVLMDTDGDSVYVTPCNDTLGTPPVRNVMSIEGLSSEMSAFEGTDPTDPETGCLDPDSCNVPGLFTFFGAFTVVPGSSNGDGLLDIADGIYILNWLFQQGPPPPCELAADANNDCSVDSSDAVYILEYIFLEGPPPPLGLGCQLVTPDTCPSLSCETAVETNC